MCEIDHTNLAMKDALSAFASVGIRCFKDEPLGEDCLYTCSGGPETQRDPIEAAGISKVGETSGL